MESPTVRATGIVALSLVVGLFFTGQTVGMAIASGRPVRPEWDILQELLFWILWALLSPRVLALARRWPLDARPLYRAAGKHAVVSVVLASAQTAIAFSLHLLVLWLVGAVANDEVAVWIGRQRPALVWGVFMGVPFYWAVVGVYTMSHFRRLYAAERLSAAELAGRSATLEAELARSQLDALRSQLRPHFLFNTLNAISVLTTEDPDKARRMVLRLGSLLRRSLDEEAHEVPLHQELLFLDDYLDIQRVRFGDRLVVDVAIDASAVDARVPVLMLQPLVENAIEHGSPDKDVTTNIALRAAGADGTLRLTIEDNGPGPGETSPLREGIGLRNTRERLRSLYGERASIHLRSLDGGNGATGTRVEITIPMAAMPASV